MTDLTQELPNTFIQSNYSTYPSEVENLNPRYLKLPRNISIETLVRCNAACGFCPYPISPRRDEEMSTELFEKIITDLSQMESGYAFDLTLHRINEPLLDKRLEHFHAIAAAALPSAKFSFWSNGTTLTAGRYDWITQYENAKLHISLNAVDESDHQRLMGIGIEKVLRNLDALHARKDRNEFPLSVSLHAPFENPEQAWRIDEFCKQRYPLFKLGIRPFFSWMGEIDTGAKERDEVTSQLIQEHNISSFPCAQWYDLHILANGYVTKCCIDESGYVNDPRYDTSTRNVLEIFHESQTLRLELPPRSSVNGCENCTHLG